VLALTLFLALQSTPRLVVTPAAPVVVAGDSLRLTAQLVDAAGQPVPNARITFQDAGSIYQGGIDSTGLVIAPSVGVLPVAVVAVLPGQRPVVRRMEVRVVAGRAARITVEPRVTRLLAGQRLRLETSAVSARNDPATDKLTFTSSAPNVVRVTEDGTLIAGVPGRAEVTVGSDRATEKLPITVVPAAGVQLDVTPPSAQARQGDVVRLDVAVRDRHGTKIDGLVPQWTMSPGEGVIGADGAFVAYKAGRYVVTASFGQRTAEATINVADRDVRRKATLLGSVIRSEFPTAEVWVHPNGKVAYLGAGPGGDRVWTIDISDPTKPTVVDSVMVNARHINDVMTSADGKVLVFTRENADDRKNGIVICTLEDPLHPKVAAHFTDGVTSGVHSAFVYTQPNHGTHVYLTNDGTGAVNVIDINDPANPKRVAEWRTPRADQGRYVHDLEVQDGLLYASYWNDGLVILDVGKGTKGGSPANPQFVSQFKYDLDRMYKDLGAVAGANFGRGTHTAWRHKNYVFIADEVFSLDAIQALFSKRVGRMYGRLQVIDVSDIEKPKSVAWYEPEYGGVHNLWVAGDTLYMGAYNAGFRAFDISGELRGDLKAQGREIADVMTASPNGHVPNAAMTWGAVVKNNLIFVNDFFSGLHILRLEPRTHVP
jgi:hypothetical protein